MRLKRLADIHFLVALRDKNPWAARLFFLLGILLFSYLFYDLV